MEEIVIVSGVRTPVGKFQGTLSDLSATQLGAIAVLEAVRRAGIDAATVDECIMGNVVSAGLGQNPARQAALHGGLPSSVGAMTINKVCGSGLKAVALAAQAIQTGNSEIVVAGGMESMTNAPYLLPNARSGFRMGNAMAVDSMVNDGLWDSFNNYHMGQTAESVAEKYKITREEQDEYALNSHRKAAEAWKECRFKSQVVPVEIPAKKKGQAPTLFERDESIREDASIEALGALKPAFKKDGSVTAGNAPGVNDAAAALVVMSVAKAKSLGLEPLARIRAQATSGVDPAWVMMAPVTGVQKVLAKAGWTADSVDLFELNEAFAVQAIAVTRELGIPFEKVNVNGGAVAIGHPIGASGARVLVTLIYEMIRRDVHRGVAALCLGGGKFCGDGGGALTESQDFSDRFTGRVKSYRQFRPRYPSTVVALLEAECGLTAASSIADIAAGTGLLAEVFLARGHEVVAVEPNEEMRATCETLFERYPRLRCVGGAAEAKGLLLIPSI